MSVPSQTHPHDDVEDHDLGLAHDLPRLLSRRNALLMLGGAGAAALAGCASSADQVSTVTAATTAPPSSAAATAAGATTQIPEETGGPYPADGSNGVNVLTQSGVVRSDIRSSFGGATGVADGVPLRIDLTVLSVSGGGAPLSGAAVYAWHADAVGRYSLYSQGAETENYLRGVQVADSAGRLSFQSIYPGAYDGRWPHVHFEVYPDVAAATTASGKLRTSQLALPEDVSRIVYADSRYPDSLSNLSRTSLDTDMVFRDGYSLQLATVTGDAASGYVASLTVPV
jgi:protocatechuate 3,4-dioxygenase beta subunit